MLGAVLYENDYLKFEIDEFRNRQEFLYKACEQFCFVFNFGMQSYRRASFCPRTQKHACPEGLGAS